MNEMEFPTTTVSLEVEGYGEFSPTSEFPFASKITKFVAVPSKNLMVLRGLSRPIIYVYNEGCRGAFIDSYRGHYERELRNHIVCLIHLVDGVVCSMDTGGNIHTWEARTAQENNSIEQAEEDPDEEEEMQEAQVKQEDTQDARVKREDAYEVPVISPQEEEEDRIARIRNRVPPETKTLGKFKVEDNSRSLVKLSDTEFAVAGGFNGVHILKHNRGRNIMQVRQISGSMTNVRNIASLGVHGDQLVVVGNDAREGGDGIAEVWNAITTTRIAHFAIGKKIDSVQVSAQYIVCAFYGDGGIEIYANDGTNRLLARVESHFLLSEEVLEVAIISGEMMMVTCAEQGQAGIVGGSSGVYFITLPGGLIQHHYEFERRAEVGCSTVLRDGRIYVGASDGKCEAFQAPENYRSDVKRYADIRYGNVAPPLVAAPPVPAPPVPAPPNPVNEAGAGIGLNGGDNVDNADAVDAGSGVVPDDVIDEVNAAGSANGGTSPAPVPAPGSRRRSRAEFEGRRAPMDARELTEELQSQRARLDSMSEQLRRKDEEMNVMRETMARMQRTLDARGE